MAHANKSPLTLQVHDLHWLAGVAPEKDLCAHGTVDVQIEDEILSDRHLCVSAAALYLPRTLSTDHTEGTPVGDQLIPCCGHGMIAVQGSDDVLIVGCPYGLDWEVRHEGADVVLQTHMGTEVVIPRADWRAAVLMFADTVEAFYVVSDIKQPYDAEDAAGYEAFRAEWVRRRRAAGNESSDELGTDRVRPP